MAAATTAQVMNEGKSTIVRFEGETSLPAGPVLVRQNGDTGEVTLSPVDHSEHNPWLEFFDFMQTVPRDEKWEEFSKIMDERPMNQMPVERQLFDSEE